jgi:flavin-dependent dehydrogenase
MSSDRTLLVVGGGPAGVTAALQACELGAQVTLLEAGQIGEYSAETVQSYLGPED